jgi:hypothetical protein
MDDLRPAQPDPSSGGAAGGSKGPATWLARCPCGGEVWGRPGGQTLPRGFKRESAETWVVWCTSCDRPLRGPEVNPALAELAERVLGGPLEANDWLSAPHPLLGDRTPRAVAATPEGLRQVREILERLEESLPA